ncbi:hypothetical protein D1872_291640 [compost metagenome]
MAGILLGRSSRSPVKEQRYHETANGQTYGKNHFGFQGKLQGLGNQITDQRQHQSENGRLHINGKLG